MGFPISATVFTPRSHNLFHGFVLLALVVAPFFAPVPAKAASTPADDLFVSVAGEPITFSALDLTLNDPAEGDPVIFDTPVLGTLSPVGNGGSLAWIYTPHAGAWGREILRYRLSADPAAPYGHVILHLVPQRSPLAGRWPTDDPSQPEAGDRLTWGFHRELGWWDHTTATLVLCDWDGEHAHSCLEAPLDPALGSWTPTMVDLTGDDFDELVLRDPATGMFRVFDIRISDTQPRTATLLSLQSFSFGRATDFFVAGRWTPGKDELGRYVLEEAAGKFYLEHGTDILYFDLFDAAWTPWPLSGDFEDMGRDQVGLYDGSTQLLTVTDPHASDRSSKGYPSSHFLLVGKIFAGRISAQAESSFIGGLDWDRKQFRLVSFMDHFHPHDEEASAGGNESSGESTSDPSRRGPIPLDVLIDPPG